MPDSRDPAWSDQWRHLYRPDPNQPAPDPHQPADPNQPADPKPTDPNQPTPDQARGPVADPTPAPTPPASSQPPVGQPPVSSQPPVVPPPVNTGLPAAPAKSSKTGLKIGLAAAAAVLAVGGIAAATLAHPSPDPVAATTPTPTATTQPASAAATPTAVASADVVVLEPVNSQGQDPFGANLADDDRDAVPVDDDQREPVPTKVQPKKWTGGEVGPYGGTLSEKVCDKNLLVSFLTTHQGQAKAWVTAQNSDPNLRWERGKLTVAQIPAYVAGLTPVTLRYDTWVTNHLYERGRAVPFGYAFQAGTKALVDKYGVIRARCKCGNPVIGPKYRTGTVRYTGKKWRGFDPNKISTIEPSREPLKAIPVVQKNGRVDYLKVGSKGLPSDRVPAPTATDPTAPVSPSALPTTSTAPPSSAAPTTTTSAPVPATTTGSTTRLSTGAFSVDLPAGYDVVFKDQSNPYLIKFETPAGGFLDIEQQNTGVAPQNALDTFRTAHPECTRVGNTSDSFSIPPTVLRDRYQKTAPCAVDNAIAFVLGSDTILVTGSDAAAMQAAVKTMSKP